MPGHNMPTRNGRGLVAPFMSSSLQISPGIPKTEPRPVIGQRLQEDQLWYRNISMSAESEFNYWFWGQTCGPVHDPSPQQKHKYMEDAISVNTSERPATAVPLPC